MGECKKAKGCKAFSFKKDQKTSKCWLKTSLENSGNRLGDTQVWYTYVVCGDEGQAKAKTDIEAQDKVTTPTKDKAQQGKPNCGWQSEKFGFIDNNFNLPNTPVKGKTLDECIAECKKATGCKAFSFEKAKEKEKSDCWLKNSLEGSGNRLGTAQKWYTYVVC